MTGTTATTVREGEDGRAVDEPDGIDEAALEEPAAEQWTARRRPVMIVTTVLLVLLLIGSVVAAALTVRQVQHRRDADAFEQAALTAGREAAVAFTTYDYRHLDTDLSRVTERSTGTFRTQFTSALGALTEAIKQARGVSRGHVAYAGLLRHRGQTAVVLAAVDASITNTSTPRPSTRRYRLQITLDHSSGSWLISQIAPVA